MHIWRQRTRRDRGKALLMGIEGWGCHKDDKSNIIDDDRLQYEEEQKHVNFFKTEVRTKMHAYLNTIEGMNEIREVAKMLKASNLAIDKKKSIYSIFRKYDNDGSESIEIEELSLLLADLNVVVEDEELETVMKFVDKTGQGEISFESFYEWFSKESEAIKKKKSSLLSWTEVILPNNFQNLVYEAEARCILLDCAVDRAVACAREEFRVSKPAKHACELCGLAQRTQRDKFLHMRDAEYHTQFEEAEQAKAERYALVDKLHSTIEGRIMRTQRYMFSKLLIPMDSRVENARAAPYRPNIADPGGRRHEQMVRGMMVQGLDPKAGIRAGYRKYGLDKQFRAPGRLENQPQFQDVLMRLLHCRDNEMDIVVGAEVSIKTYVRFVWKEFAAGTCCIKGEFTGWKVEELKPDLAVDGRFSLVKDLGPGKYRYIYVVDGVEMVDRQAAVTIENGKELNIFQIINPMIDSDNKGKSATNTKNKALMIDSSRRSAMESAPTPTSSKGSEFGSFESGSVVNGSESPSQTMKLIGDRQEVASMPPMVLQRLTGTATASHRQLAIVTVGQTNTQETESHRNELMESLRHINLRNVALCDDGAWTFALFMQANSVVESVDISYNGISDDGMQGIGSCLDELKCLKVLNLCGNSFSCDGCKHISEPLHIHKNIQILELSKNCIGDDGAEYVANILVHHSTLHTLLLDSCLIGDDGIQAIAEKLWHNRSLTILNVGRNRITQVGVNALTHSVRANCSLLELRLHYNYLAPEGVRFVADMLIWNKTLTSLDLSATGMASHGSIAGIHSVFNGLRNNRSLRTLVLNYNELDDDKVMYGAFELSFNKTLTGCSIVGNKCGPQWMQANSYIKCRLLEKLPSIQTTLDNNIRISKDPVLSRIFGVKPSHYKNEEGYDGAWDAKRFWRKTDYKKVEKTQQKVDEQNENERIRVEDEYIEEHTRLYLQSMIAYIDETEAGVSFVRNVAKCVAAHITDLFRVDPEWGAWEEEEKEAIGSTVAASINGDAAAAAAATATNELFADGSAAGLLPPLLEATPSPSKRKRKAKHQKKGVQFGPGSSLELPPTADLSSTEHQLGALEGAGEAVADGDAHVGELAAPQSNSEVKQNAPKNSLFPSLFRSKSETAVAGASAAADSLAVQVSQTQAPKKSFMSWTGWSTGRRSEAGDRHEQLMQMFLEKDYPPDHPAYQTQQKMKEIHRQREIEKEIQRQKELEELELRRQKELEISRLPKKWSVIQDELFHSTHIAIMSAIFRELGADWNTMLLDPQLLPSVFTALAIPTNAHEIQKAMEKTLVVSEQKIGFLKCCKYVLKNARRLCQRWPLQRMRIVADLVLHPPVEEARIIVLDLAAYDRRLEMRKQYREAYLKAAEIALKDNRGEGGGNADERSKLDFHMCHFCGLRFANHKILMKHKAKRGGYLHKRFLYFRDIATAQREFLRAAKSSILGMRLPAYYQVAPGGDLPQDYYPQVIDRIGTMGRPYGALDQDACICVEDCMGDYLRVRFEGSLGWSLLKMSYYNLLIPACSTVRGFQGWDELETFRKPVYFRVRTDIRARLELKVRHFPTKDSAVCGYLKAGMIVECRAVLGCWLQIRYEQFEGAWVVHTTGGGASLSSPQKRKEKQPPALMPLPEDGRQDSNVNRFGGGSTTPTRDRSRGGPSSSSASPMGRLDALNAALKETRIVASGSEAVGQSRLQLGNADDDSSVNSIGSLGSDESKVDFYFPSKQKKKKSKKKKKRNLLAGIRQNVDQLLESGQQIELLYQLHPCIQRKLVHTLLKSPCLMADDELEFEDDEEEEFSSMLARFRDGADTEDDAIALEALDERVLTPMYR